MLFQRGKKGFGDEGGKCSRKSQHKDRKMWNVSKPTQAWDRTNTDVTDRSLLPWHRCFVDTKGTLRVCCHLEMSAANLKYSQSQVCISLLRKQRIYAVKLPLKVPILKYSRKRNIHLFLKLQNNIRYPVSLTSELWLSGTHWKPAADRAETQFCSKYCMLAEKADLQKGRYFI